MIDIEKLAEKTLSRARKNLQRKGNVLPLDVRSRTPRVTVSLAAASASTVARIGPMHGVHPNGNAKPSRKPLHTLGCVLLPRRCTSRFSQRAIAGPRKPTIDNDKK